MKRFSAKSIAPFLVAVMIPVLSGITFFARAEVTPAKVQAAGKRKAPAAVAEAVRLKYNNENVQMNLGVGLWGIPLPYDMDGDGLKDLFVCSPDTPYKGVYYYHNIGTAEKPFFDRGVRVSGNKPNKNLRYSEYAGVPYVCIPDGRYDDFFGNPDAKASPILYKNPLPRYEKCRTNMWNMADWDGDGDIDIIAGLDSWDDYGWDNAYDAKGRWMNGPLHGYVYLIENKNGKYVNVGRIQAAGRDIDVYGAPMPCVADFDGDGDLDIICGEFLDRLTWFENVGTREKPVFAAGRRVKDTAGNELRFHIEMIVPVAVDFDGDGRTDLLIGDEDGTVAYARNSGKVAGGMPLFEPWYTFRQKSDDLKYGALSTPRSVDWDGDGLEDMICGNSAGEICLLRNLGYVRDDSRGIITPVWDAPKAVRAGGKPFRVMAGDNGSVQGPAECKWGYTVVDVADWDGDGYKDIIFNSIWGKIQWLRNLGSNDGLSFAPARAVCIDGVSAKPEWNWWDPAVGELVTQWRTTPVVTDWDGDGILDIIMLDNEGYLALYQGVGKGKTHKVKQPRRVFYGTDCSLYSNRDAVVDSHPGPLCLNNRIAGQSGRRKICFADWDNDGRKDLFVDGVFGAVWFRQLAPQDGKYYFKFEGRISSTRLEGHTTCPTPVDWDCNGIYDIVVGAEDGHFYYLANPYGL